MSNEKPTIEDIRFAPTDGLTYNPNEAKYWDDAALDKELLRSFELCHGCRMCFKFCPSFPTLFDAIDAADGNVRSAAGKVLAQVVDECFQCKLCYTNCPYTADEGHEFLLDFPRLLQRAKAVSRRKTGVPLREKLLGDPDRLGKLGTRTAPLANFANRFAPARAVMQTVLGIHRKKLLPTFASQSFSDWFRARTKGRNETPTGRHLVVLFSTCFVNWNRPQLGRAAIEVLEHNDCRVACPELGCCGMPALDGGNVAFARKEAESNVRRLLPLVEQGYRIAVINPTCSLMMRKEYPELLNDPANPALAEAARKIAAATMDLSEFLFELRKQGDFREDFRSTPNGPVAYHAPCHLRMQSIGFRGRDLLRRIPGVQPKLVAECCGHDGTWAMKTEHFDQSRRYGQKAFDGMNETGAELWTSDCPLAALQFEQMCGRKALHPIEVLARAYRADGFPTGVSSEESEEKESP